MKICVTSQTPLIRFKVPAGEITKHHKKIRDAIPLSSLSEGTDYEFTPGGVTRMVLPLLKHMLDEKKIRQPHWVSLNPGAPERVLLDGITLANISLKSEKMKGYGYVKEAIWKEVHGIPREPVSATSLAWSDEFSDYTQYNRLCSETIHKLDAESDFDIFYMHDFQQLPTGVMLDTLKPKIFRWHIPLDENSLSAEWRAFLANYMNRYNTVIVSSKKYLDSLRKFGYSGSAHYIYPYIDPETYKAPSRKQLDGFCGKFNISDSDKVILVVARLDPMKGQDRAIKAIARVAKDVPNVKLVLAGNGSFSSAKQGLGLSKAAKWLSELVNLSRNLKVEGKVVFTGHITHEELEAAYARCDLTLLPSVKEGFGLVVIESWLYKKPTIVSSNAGIVELISDGENGILADPDDIEALASKISGLLSDSEKRASLGQSGFAGSKKCHIREGVRAESELLMNVLEGE